MLTSLIPIRDHNPYRRFPFVTVAVIGVCLWAALTIGWTERAVFEYGAIPCDIVDKCPSVSDGLERAYPGRVPLLSLVTSMFMHGGWAHLIGNMLYLWVFGNNVEDRLGSLRYVVFYLVSGLAAVATHMLLGNLGSQVPLVGASGAISGVLGAYLMLWPHARVVALVPFLLFASVEVSARTLLGMWFLLQLLNGVGTLGANTGVAFFAHVGGFVAGVVLIKVMEPGRREPELLRD